MSNLQQPERTVTLEIDERGVAYLTMVRESVHNAFDDHMIAALIEALAQVEQQPQARLLVLRSQGKHFSAGADLQWMRSMADKDYQQNLDDAAQLATLMQRLDELSKPTICLVQGAAFGGAVGLAACCDIVLAEARASFCLSEVKIGLIPAVISPYVIRAMGERQARRYMLSAERFFADVAQQYGLVHEVCDDLSSRSQALIDSLLANSPAALAACKQLISDLSYAPVSADMRQQTIERIAAIRVSEEGQEGLSAFLEKRPADWTRG
ncbi:enoyl-CoA hydratase-related protein [Idiomarina xiamenensis]|uniref:Enoyl-CoA hydratase n=1 Tax=Idiomarina xiamenensis 10-D-4 TaxID=740709 RepID=K2KDS7_9GAMM|nr:enoyl-CoA hydratase-related protein [Idiomarina xiamenensis]EKE84887.1 enoyl-CoA hydratase [Idiomarina xiamenensis 10-D-4]